ncbi:MAG: hypothetical protein KDA91_14880 [Planctomycetaceae bacterium]|nr:hypothetical protein [Planctomycetaceae bacterium]
MTKTLTGNPERLRLIEELNSVDDLKTQYRELCEQTAEARKQFQQGLVPENRIRFLDQKSMELGARISRIVNQHPQTLQNGCRDESLNAEKARLVALRSLRQKAVGNVEAEIEAIELIIHNLVSSNLTQQYGPGVDLKPGEKWPDGDSEKWARRFSADGSTFMVEARPGCGKPDSDLIRHVNVELARQWLVRRPLAEAASEAARELADVNRQIESNREARIYSPV